MSRTELQIQLFGSKVLKSKTKAVKKFDSELKADFEAMLEMMRELNGIGLAANQAGLKRSMVVIELADTIYYLANPKIIDKQGQTSIEEGCLSFPDVVLEVPRYDRVTVEYQDETGTKHQLEADKLLAIVLQHEIDHINGMTFNQRVSRSQQKEIEEQLKEIKRQSKELGQW